jgi:hypothetical protein
MRQPCNWLAVLLTLGLLASAEAGAAADTPSPSKTAADRQAILDKMLTDDYESSWIAGFRRLCAAGGAPGSVAEDRAENAYFAPDAADQCVTALVRTARDRRLAELYGKLLAELGGSADGAERLPRAIGAAVLNGTTKVAIGNKKAAEVTPALAFDAGFTVAYQEGSASKATTADTVQLRTLAEACLGQHQDAGTCFSVGYVYGARATRGQLPLVSR